MVDYSILIVLFFSDFDVIEKNIVNANNFNVEFIICDNSLDEKYHQKIIKWKQKLSNELKSKIKIVKSPTNSGYTGGNNLAFKYSKGKYLIILNPDMELDNSFFIELKRIMKKERYKLLSVKQFQDYEKKRISCGLIRQTLYHPLRPFDYIGAGLENDNLEKKIYNTFYAQGGCLIIEREIFKKLKGFDESFFMYYEETDLCQRAKKNGITPVYCPNLISIHYNPKIYSLFAEKLIFRNHLIFIGRNFSLLLFFIQFFYSFLRGLSKIINKKQRRLKFEKIFPIFQSILEGFKVGIRYFFFNNMQLKLCESDSST